MAIIFEPLRKVQDVSGLEETKIDKATNDIKNHDVVMWIVWIHIKNFYRVMERESVMSNTILIYLVYANIHLQ